MENLLTVTEVAAYLRTTTTTIYRWLKQGKLSAVKIGKEWRISEEQLKALLTHTKYISSSFWTRLRQSEHLLLIAEKNEEITDFEISFFKQALNEGASIMKGCWWQDVEEVCHQYQQQGLDVEALEKDGQMKIFDFKTLYRMEGIDGPVKAWSSSIEHVVSKGLPCLWASGSPTMDCCGYNAASLLSFEAKLNQTIQGMPVVGICPYSLEHKSNQENLGHLISLMDCHSGVVFYSENQYMLLRQ